MKFNLLKRKIITILSTNVILFGFLCSTLLKEDQNNNENFQIKYALNNNEVMDSGSIEHMVHIDGPGPIVSLQKRFYYQIMSISVLKDHVEEEIIDEYYNYSDNTLYGKGNTSYQLHYNYATIPLYEIYGTKDYSACEEKVKELVPYSECSTESLNYRSPIMHVGPHSYYKFVIQKTETQYLLRSRSTRRNWSWGSWSSWRIENPERDYAIEIHKYNTAIYTEAL